MTCRCHGQCTAGTPPRQFPYVPAAASRWQAGRRVSRCPPCDGACPAHLAEPARGDRVKAQKSSGFCEACGLTWGVPDLGFIRMQEVARVVMTGVQLACFSSFDLGGGFPPSHADRGHVPVNQWPVASHPRKGKPVAMPGRNAMGLVRRRLNKVARLPKGWSWAGLGVPGRTRASEGRRMGKRRVDYGLSLCGATQASGWCEPRHRAGPVPRVLAAPRPVPAAEEAL